MGKVRGYRMGRRLMRVFQWFIRRRRKGRINYKRLGSSNYATKAISKLCNFGNLLKYGGRPNSGYIRVGQDFMEQKEMVVPKGHLAVYVGEQEDNACRVLVPVIYFNHPLFADLLREAEMEYGFNHSGGIQIPCRISEFEYVQSRIAATGGGGRCPTRRSWRHKYW